MRITIDVDGAPQGTQDLAQAEATESLTAPGATRVAPLSQMEVADIRDAGEAPGQLVPDEDSVMAEETFVVEELPDDTESGGAAPV